MWKYVAQCGHTIDDIEDKVCPICKKPIIKMWDENELGKERLSLMIMSFNGNISPDKMIIDGLEKNSKRPFRKIDYEILMKCIQWEENHKELRKDSDYRELRKLAIKNIINDYFERS